MQLKLPKPYLSYSQISTWHYNKGQYVDRYIFNIPTIETPQLIYGKTLSTYLEKGKWGRAPAATKRILDKLTRYEVPEHELRTTFQTKKGSVEFLGFIDSYSPKRNIIREYKTGGKVWDQARADEHLQTLIYAGIIYKQTGKLPKVYIDWIPTHIENGVCVPDGNIKTFRVLITVPEVLKALREVQKVAIEIHDWYEEYLGGAMLEQDPNSPAPAIPDWMK